MLGFKTERKRVALVGSAPSSVSLAPYRDDSWFIVGCSPGAYGHAGPHSDAWMEIHRWEPQVAGHAGTGKPWFSPEYCEFLTRFDGAVYMLDQLPPEVPNATLVPHMEVMDEFGPYFFTSSLSWMMAQAILTPGVEEIGMWGVDMAANEEYEWQRPGLQFFIQEAIKRGIKVTVPPESDLLQPALWYGISENEPMFIKFQERQRELQGRKAQCEQIIASKTSEMHFLNGALDNISYTMKTWVTSNCFLRPTFGPTGNEVRAEEPTATVDSLVPVTTPDVIQHDGPLYAGRVVVEEDLLSKSAFDEQAKPSGTG